MIGLIRLTDALDDKPIHINPQCITLFKETTPDLVKCFNANLRPIPGSTTLVVGAMIYLVRENSVEIVSAISRLNRRAEDAALALKKRAERQEWQDEDEENY